MKGFRHDLRSQEDRLDSSRAAAIEERRTTLVESSRLQNPVDIALIDELLREPSITDGQRRSLESNRAWLTENTHRCLARFIREKILRWQKAIARAKVMRARGIEPLPREKWKRSPPRFARSEKAERPAWMNDPSLLPKSPPGRKP